MRIAVLCGGTSPERDVSISTGVTVAGALRRSGHCVALVDTVRDYAAEAPAQLFGFDSASDDYIDADIAETAPDTEAIIAKKSGFFGSNVIEICHSADIVFNALHGDAGEDGRLQATFDLLGIKYTGSGAKGCMLAMDKLLTKQLLAVAPHAIRTPRGMVIRSESYAAEGLPCGVDALGTPLVVKPVSGGSSVGVSIVNDNAELKAALETAFCYENRVLIEECVKGREFSVGILGNKALPVIEIRPLRGFYDYKNKYQKGFAKETCPADIDRATTAHMQRMAEIAYSALSLSAYARVDFMMNDAGVVYCLEANTLPGMTPISLLPQEAVAAGISFEELCCEIVLESFKKYNNRG